MASIEIFDRTMQRVAYFDTAVNVVETVKINAVSTLTFELPYTDPKVDLCKLRYFAAVNGGEKYRILDRKITKDDVTMVLFECEHAIATLADNIMFRDHVVGNIGTFTEDVINYILSFQTTAHWVLTRCDYHNQYEYAWTSENLLQAMFSVTDPLLGVYMWTFNTSRYPFELGLVEIDASQRPQFYIMDGLNWRSSQRHEQSSTLFTRIYPQGYGEGVNQLGIAEINDGAPYVDASAAAMAEYGLVEGVWTDRRYEDAASLLASAQAMVSDLSAPLQEYTVEIADLFELRGGSYSQADSANAYRAAVGRIVQFDDGYKTYITETKRNYDRDGDLTIAVANKIQTVATTLADLADRQRIEATYSQGATQLWGSPLQDNADSTSPLVYNLWIPEGAKIINKVAVKVKLSRGRAYSQSTASGGGSSQTSSSGGGSTQTTSVDSEKSRTSSSGGSATVTSSTGGGMTSTQENTQFSSGEAYTSGSSHRHTIGGHLHGIANSSHSHTVNLPSHSHTVTIPEHAHTVNTPEHEHNVNIPDHTHDIVYGIFLASESPTSAIIKVGDVLVAQMGTEYEADITAHLVDESGTIPRGRFIEISVAPDIFAYVAISVAAQGFIQSKEGGRY